MKHIWLSPLNRNRLRRFGVLSRPIDTDGRVALKMVQPLLRVPEPTSAPGDFYVDSNCCTACGVPQVVAPDLVGWTAEKIPQCRWKKQPSAPAEFQQAFAIFDSQELGCHRYAGTDPEIQKRVGIENCDFPLALPEREESMCSPAPTPSLKAHLTSWLKKSRRKG
jgi:hypothetical protein